MKTPKRQLRPTLLPQDLLDMMDRGVSVIVSSCSASLKPSVMRALCSRVAPDGDNITVYVSRTQSAQLIQDIRDTGQRDGLRGRLLYALQFVGVVVHGDLSFSGSSLSAGQAAGRGSRRQHRKTMQRSLEKQALARR
jgi:hypothetical protein